MDTRRANLRLHATNVASNVNGLRQSLLYLKFFSLATWPRRRQHRRNPAMKLLMIMIIAVSLSAAHAAKAEKLDFSEMSCAAFLQSDKDTSKLVITWFIGFYTEANDPQVLDLSTLNDFQIKFTAFCKQEPSFHMSTAAEGIFGR
jgi:acid stress chaperone HdeB